MKKSLINPETIASLRELSEPGKDFYAEMAFIYLQQAPAKVNALESQLSNRDFAAISAATHQLKSSTGNLGAEDLASLFVRAEEAAKNKDVENLLRVLPELKSSFALVQAALEEIIASPTSQAA